MKKIFLQLIIVLGLFMVGCSQQNMQLPVQEIEDTPAVDIKPIPEGDQTDEALEPDSDPEPAEEESTGPEIFVPITVEDFGITTMVPADWPAIEGDPLLKNAWGPGEYRFVAFHSVPGEDVSSAMAQLLGTTPEELLTGPAEGEYWEEKIGDYDWAMYTVDNPDIGLGQSVSMTTQGGVIYIISLFVELDYREVVLNAVLENFDISSAVVLNEVETVDEASPTASEDGTAGISEEEAAAVPDGTQPDLLTTAWVLSRIADADGELQDVIAGVQVTAEFKESDRVSGNAGCNDYVSNYTLEDETVTITVPAMTRKNCDDPEGVMLQETNFVSNLTTVAYYQINDQELELLDSSEDTVLIFSMP